MADTPSALPPLLPCPFCGGTDLDEESTHVIEGRSYAHQSGWLVCKCGVCGPSADVLDVGMQPARDAWNRRAALAAKPEAAPPAAMAAVATIVGYIHNGYRQWALEPKAALWDIIKGNGSCEHIRLDVYTGEPQQGSWIAAEDVRRSVRELDVALNGEDGAAPQAALIDILAQVKTEARKLGRPLLATPPQAQPAHPPNMIHQHWANWQDGTYTEGPFAGQPVGSEQAQPAQASEPLTEDAICTLCTANFKYWREDIQQAFVVQLARAIEAAHGIHPVDPQGDDATPEYWNKVQAAIKTWPVLPESDTPDPQGDAPCSR